ncbi:hypothetical protein [Sorangium sp. So ce1024]|uniref:hypothetical protein n=1 Tax=Sorangium sp. So ce1024 TaxID=3133327 RepID=UPI003F0A3040
MTWGTNGSVRPATERELVAGLLSGRLKPRDTRGYDVLQFQDRTMQRLFFAVETLRLHGYSPTTPRILVGFAALKWDATGVAELVEQLRGEG